MNCEVVGELLRVTRVTERQYGDAGLATCNDTDVHCLDNTRYDLHLQLSTLRDKPGRHAASRGAKRREETRGRQKYFAVEGNRTPGRCNQESDDF